MQALWFNPRYRWGGDRNTLPFTQGLTTTNMETKDIHYLEIPTGSKAYFHYDKEHGTVEYDGQSYPIPEDKFIDFLHTANMIGLKAGKI